MSRDPKMFISPMLIHSFLDKCKAAGHSVLVTSVDRSMVEQDALYSQGRNPLAVVNAMRKTANLPPITDAANLKCVTWTRKSEHLTSKEHPLSRAFDFVVLKDGKAVWDVKADINADNIPDYEQCAKIGESIGLFSGMRFSKQDYPHLQVTQIT